MTSRLVRSCLVVLFSVLACHLRAQTPRPTPPPPSGATTSLGSAKNPQDPVTFRLPSGDLDAVLDALEIYTGRTILRPGSLPSTPNSFSLKLDGVPRQEAVLAIETVLALNGIGVAPQGDRFLVVTPLQMTRSNAPEMITGSAFDQPPSGKIAVKVFQLQFLRVQEFQQLIAPILNQLLTAQPVALLNSNAIMITDSVSNLQRVEALVQQLDKPAMAGMRPKFYQLHNGAKASDLVQKIRTMLPQNVQQQLGITTSYQADDRTNQIVIVTDPAQYPIFDELIERLDIVAAPNTRNEVIYLKHADATALSTVLTNIITGQTSAAQRQNNQSTRPNQIFTPNVPVNVPPVAGAVPNAGPAAPVINAAEPAGSGSGAQEFSALVTQFPDKRSNSIVVSGTTDDIKLITELINKLDIILPQVRIECVIAEVTLDDSHSSGISQLGLKVVGNRLVGFTGSAVGTAIGGTGSATDVATISPLGVAKYMDLTALISLNTTPRKNNTTVLSVPSITTAHAQKGFFTSTEKRPITTGTTSTPVGTTNSSNGFSTQEQVQYQDIGITLTVTPLIGSDSSVYLSVDQIVDDVSGSVQVNGNDQPIISHRQATSFVTAQSGDIIVLGGMQRNKDSRNTSRLGPIPFLGDFFGARSKALTRTELIFFLRPYVLTNTPADNAPIVDRIQELPAHEVPQKEEIHKLIDPAYVPPKQTILDKVLHP
ncbi:MAG TPA: secretin N-terminal domain-containing protein [Opitutaceae bacterium]|nr:secretin N-terminal domain-containing protein [Opitutaceae bacterium]